MWRALNQIYTKYMIYLKNQISIYDFYGQFGIDTNSAKIFEKMEQQFSCYVRGKDNEERYLTKYRKNALMQSIKWM